MVKISAATASVLNNSSVKHRSGFVFVVNIVKAVGLGNGVNVNIGIAAVRVVGQSAAHFRIGKRTTVNINRRRVGIDFIDFRPFALIHFPQRGKFKRDIGVNLAIKVKLKNF